MTDLEISKQLALAIGWPDAITDSAGHYCFVWDERTELLRKFDYRDWRVIGPIAEQYNCFPYLWEDGRWGAPRFTIMHYADTPQKAIALAVIEGAKK